MFISYVALPRWLGIVTDISYANIKQELDVIGDTDSMLVFDFHLFYFLTFHIIFLMTSQMVTITCTYSGSFPILYSWLYPRIFPRMFPCDSSSSFFSVLPPIPLRNFSRDTYCISADEYRWSFYILVAIPMPLLLQ